MVRAGTRFQFKISFDSIRTNIDEDAISAPADIKCSMRTRIKICCIASIAEARLAIRYGADAIGLVAAVGPRRLDDRTIAAIAAVMPPPIATFMLTSDSTADSIAELVRATGPCTVQIVPHISTAESQKLVGLLPMTRRVQVIHVEDERALDLIPGYAPNAHAFLLDSGRPGLETPEYGGTGRTHDWEVSAEFVRRSPLPVFLAGGISPSNVGEAIRRVRPFAVDLCSGVRTDGRLDQQKLIAFIDAVRSADAGAA
jgi:phosphoribosylanthranilate isomerase